MLNALINEFKNKKLVILGFGREGLSTYRFIRRFYPDMHLTIADKNPVTLDDENVTVVTGDNYLDACFGCDLVMKAPGIPTFNMPNWIIPKITCQTHLFLKHFGKLTVGITGTKGKSTTSSLIYHILAASGKKALLVGNIGSPAFDSLDEIDGNATVVYELSCHQLELCPYSPEIAVLLNLYEEHLDHYGTLENYFNAKKNIFLHQKSGIFIYDSGNKNIDNIKTNSLTASIKDKSADIYSADGKIIFKGKAISLDTEKIKIKGAHNFGNIGIAYAVTSILGVSASDFANAVYSFTGLNHRLQFVGTFDGIHYYDDSISTIPATAIAAMESLENVGSIMLGGMERGIDYSPLRDYLKNHPLPAIILMPDTGIRLYDMLCDAGLKKICHLSDSLETAVAFAKKYTPKGTACLFSPAAASYHQFKNFEARGNAFQQLLKE